MKLFCVILLCLLAIEELPAQVIFRNDFVISHKSKRLQNKGITHITFNIGARNLWNLNAYGQQVRSITVDVRALRGKTDYTYREIVEKIYRPGAVYRQSYIPIPLFLLLEPPRKMKVPAYAYSAHHPD